MGIGKSRISSQIDVDDMMGAVETVCRLHPKRRNWSNASQRYVS